MRFGKVMAAPLAILVLTLLGCGGGGGGGAAPVPPGDTVAPTVSITQPVNVSTTGTTTVSASASDNLAVTRVELWANNALQATLTSAPYNFSWNTASLTLGSYTLVAKAYDAAGNVGLSSNVVVTVPITVSMSTVVAPGGGTAVGTVTLHGLATPDAFGLNLNATLPAGASIASAIPSGVAASDSPVSPVGSFVVVVGTVGFGSGEVMKINFANVPAGAVPANFGIALSAVFDGNGVQIQ